MGNCRVNKSTVFRNTQGPEFYSQLFKGIYHIRLVKIYNISAHLPKPVDIYISFNEI